MLLAALFSIVFGVCVKGAARTVPRVCLSGVGISSLSDPPSLATISILLLLSVQTLGVVAVWVTASNL